MIQQHTIQQIEYDSVNNLLDILPEDEETQRLVVRKSKKLTDQECQSVAKLAGKLQPVMELTQPRIKKLLNYAYLSPLLTNRIDQLRQNRMLTPLIGEYLLALAAYEPLVFYKKHALINQTCDELLSNGDLFQCVQGNRALEKLVVLRGADLKQVRQNLTDQNGDWVHYFFRQLQSDSQALDYLTNQVKSLLQADSQGLQSMLVSLRHRLDHQGHHHHFGPNRDLSQYIHEVCQEHGLGSAAVQPVQQANEYSPLQNSTQNGSHRGPSVIYRLSTIAKACFFEQPKHKQQSGLNHGQTWRP